MILRINPGSTHEAPLPGKPHYPWLGFPFSLLLLLTFLFPVNAQNTTTLSASPVISQVMLNSQVSLDLMLTDAVNVNAFDVIVEYDDALLRLDGWANGGFLSNLAVVVKTDNPGYFRLFCTQLATPPVSGNGTLIRLSFTGVGVGRTDIALTKGELADSQGNNTDVVLGGARVDVSSQIEPTLTATPTVTRTQPPVVLTPTQTATAPAFPTLAPSPTRSTLPGPQDPYPGQEPTAVIPPFPTQPPAREPGSTQPPMMGETEPTAQFPTPMSGELENTPLSPVATGLPVSNVPLRNTDQASVWQAQPARGVDLPWIILGVELVVLLGLVIMLLIRRHRP